MKKVLLLTDVNFWERSSGNRERIYSLIEYLAPRVILTVVNTGPVFNQQLEPVIEKRFNIEFHVLQKNKHMSSSGYGRRLKKLLGDRQFDAVIVEYIHSSYFLNYLVNDAIIILDTHDIIGDRTEEFRRFNYAGALYELPSNIEIQILNVYDYVMAICEPDRDRLKQLTGREDILLCPHPVTTRPHILREEVKNITFIASAYLPNKDAINFFIENCWGELSSVYDIELSVYGTVCEGVRLKGHKNITLKGFAPDINTVYDEADIVINPVRFGAGLKIKNIEALANGLPLATTSHGARGLEMAQNKAFIKADSPADFTQAIASLIKNKTLRQQLSDAACQYINAHFSEEVCYKQLMEVING